MNTHLQSILNFLQQSPHLSDEEKTELLKAAKAANKELEITAFKLDRTEKVKHTTAILLEETIEELEQKRKAVEAQNRELEVEAALEKVRSRSMAMQYSDELSETVYVLFQQFKALGENPDQATIGIVNEDENVIEYWVTMYGNQINKVFKFSIDEPNVTHKIYQGWKANKKSLVIDLSGDALREFMTYRAGKGGAAINPDEKRRIINVAFFSKGLLNVQSNEERSDGSIKLLERFAFVFEQTYTRFLDLQKAEAQARESQIQLALERVRARTMAMQRSDELTGVAELLFKQVNDLGIKAWSTGFKVWSFDNNFCTDYVTNPQGGFIEPYTIDSTQYRVFVEVSNAKKRGDEFFVKYEEGEQLIETYRQLSKYGEKQFKAILDSGFQFPVKQYEHHVFGSKASLMFITYEPVSEAHDIFIRFGKVFEQTYTRFLDLQKAEAQAREAQIELALERVRARTMAMQKSDDLAGAVAVIFEELDRLSTGILRCGIGIINKENRTVNVWTTSKSDENTPIQISGDESMDSHPLLQGAFNAWLKQEEYSYVLHGKDLTDYYKAQAAANFKLPDSQSLMTANEDLYQYYFLSTFQAGGLFAFRETAFPDEAKKVMKRFAGVFNLTYKRFLDLQKAEAQAREAQIETALERVRSRSMGMQKSEELKEVIQVVYDQFVHLNINVEHTGFIMDYKARDDMHIWLADKHEVPFQVTIPYFDCAHWNSFNEAKEKGIDFFANHLSFEEKNKFYQDLFKLIPGVPEDTLEYYFSCPGLAISTVLLENVCLYIENFSGIPYSNAENNTLMRFGKVFQQTYTRFLDLQKAEAQARESQIQLALERVRARTMAMQQSEELAEAATVLFQQVKALGVPQWTCGFSIFEIDDKEFTWYPGSADGEILPPIKIPLTEHPVFISFNESRKRGDELFVYEKGGEFQADHYGYMRSLPGGEEMYQNTLKAGLTLPAFQIDHIANFSHGNLVFITYEHFPEMHDVFKRFAKVFEQTYTRFLDLQKAEAQALEAIKRASVDRVRAEIASMRTTSDLERIQPLIWDELKTLGVPFIRCGVFIMDEEKQEMQTMLSTPKGKAIATLHVPFEFDLTIITNGVKYWRKKEVYKDHWDAAAFTKNWIKLASLRETSIDSPQAEHPPENLYLHMLPFLQGMLYVGNETPLNEDELQLVQNLGDAFSTAYARYEDFNKLESANIKIEKTLVDLKQTQSQLIQSEKMASLGELTAGIAHEIQNPLNFVNNFSEVNKEMIAELKEEIDKGNYDEVKIIADDIEANEEKINHHGRRADAIVKGMLQHSRSSTGVKEPTDINALADEYLRLSYHGLRAKNKDFNATMKTDFDGTIGSINIIPQDTGRVLLNLYNNAFYAVSEKKKQQPENYEPTVIVSTEKSDDKILISVKDNGNGIPQKIVDKIFQPFFTTKPTGEGTGLGLSLSYDIIKAHGGEIKVGTKENEGTTFTIILQYT